MKRLSLVAALAVTGLALAVPATVLAEAGSIGPIDTPPFNPEGIGTITDGEATFVWNGFGNVNTDNAHFTWRGTTDHMFENSWYFRIVGDNDESFFPGPTSSNFSGNTATLDWTDVNGRGFSAQLISTVVDGGGGALAQVTHQLTLTNLNPQVTLQIEVFAYLDLDLTNTSTEDEGQLLSNPDLMEQFDVDTNFEFGGVGAGAFQVTDTQDGVGSLRTLFTDGLATALNGSGLPFGPADMEGAFQWSAAIAPSGSATFVRTEEITDSVKVPVELIEVSLD